MAHDILLALEWYDYRIHRGVARVAAREGWHLTCPSGRPGFQPVPEGWRGQGAIALAGDGWLTALRRRRVAVVDIGLSASQQVPRTVVDNQAVADVAFAFLRERGWRRLACVTVSGVRMLDERREAFVARAGAAGLPCPVWALEEVPRYLASAAPVAVFAVQDTLGAQVQAVARRLGLSVPAQVGILGVDDMDLICQALPVPLASVDTDQEGLGVAAVERLARILAGQPDNAGLIRHPPRGVVARASAEAFGTDHPGLRAALDLAHLDPACGIRALAAAAGLSPQGLDLVCQRELGLTPGILLRRLRLRRAGDHLAQGRSLDQAAAAAGMASASGLCAVVRRELGLTPAQWRRTLQC